MARPVAKLLTAFCILAAVLLVVAVVLTLSRPVPAPPLPVPNGYDDFLRATELLSGSASDYTQMSRHKLRAVVSTNAEALKLVKVGLSRECRVPLDYSPVNSVTLRSLPGIKGLAQAMAATGRLAELENRPADAAEAYVAAIRLGIAASQGGLIINSLVGVAIEAIGTGPLERLLPALDARQCRQAAAALESSDSRREPIRTVLVRERAWSRRAYGFKGLMIRLVTFKSVRQTEQRTAARVQAQQTRLRHLLIQLAARAHELERGDRPKNLGDLVPAYLKAIPLDPLTGTNMTYHP